VCPARAGDWPGRSRRRVAVTNLTQFQKANFVRNQEITLIWVQGLKPVVFKRYESQGGRFIRCTDVLGSTDWIQQTELFSSATNLKVRGSTGVLMYWVQQTGFNRLNCFQALRINLKVRGSTDVLMYWVQQTGFSRLHSTY
jgi:hypothetical protein